jgi:hypothetical protein
MDGSFEVTYDGIVAGDGDCEGIMGGSLECHCFRACCQKSDFLPSPKISTSMT